jgi:hypothetical protein
MENEIKKECMICWEECDEPKLKCKCKGTNGYVHMHCMRMSKSSKCPHCRSIIWYNIINPNILRIFRQNICFYTIIILFLIHCDYCSTKIKQKQEMSYIEGSTCYALPWAVEQIKAICCYLAVEQGETCSFRAILRILFPPFGIIFIFV